MNSSREKEIPNKKKIIIKDSRLQINHKLKDKQTLKSVNVHNNKWNILISKIVKLTN